MIWNSMDVCTYRKWMSIDMVKEEVRWESGKTSLRGRLLMRSSGKRWGTESLTEGTNGSSEGILDEASWWAPSTHSGKFERENRER